MSARALAASLALAAATLAYNTLFATQAAWTPAITGRAVLNHVHTRAAIHATPGARVLIDDIATWLLGGTGTALYVDTDMGLRGWDFLGGIQK